MCQLLCVPAQLFLPGIGLLAQPGQAGRCGDGQAAIEPPGNRHHLVAVRNLRQGRSLNPLQQHREPLVVALMQQDGAAPGPRHERVRLMGVAGMRKRHFQHSGLLSPPSYRDDDTNASVQDLAIRHALPAPQ